VVEAEEEVVVAPAVLVLVPEWAQVLVPGQVLVPEQDLVLGQVRGRVLVALAWVLDQGQALVKVDLDQVAIKDRTAMAPAMEPAMTVLVRQTVQALALVTAPVRAVMDRAAAANANLLSLSKDSPHLNPRSPLAPPKAGKPLPRYEGGWQGEGTSLAQQQLSPSSINAQKPMWIIHPLHQFLSWSL